jgi:hypothetical protein
MNTQERETIRTAQRLLNDAGYRTTADGIFGQGTGHNLRTALQRLAFLEALASQPVNVLPFPKPAAAEPAVRLVEGPDRDDSDILDWIQENPTAPARIEVLTSTKGMSFRDAARHLMDADILQGNGMP